MPLKFYLENGGNDKSFEYLTVLFENSEYFENKWYLNIPDD